jgi:hypothetical protein
MSTGRQHPRRSYGRTDCPAVKGVISGSTATKFKYEGTEIDVIIKGDEYFNEKYAGAGTDSD